MFPSKSMMEYMIEMNRLFPGTCENDANLFNPGMSPFNSTIANRSSSSADSTSPDSFDLPMSFRQDFYPRHDLTPIRETSRPTFDTPRPESQMRRRPIIGRKLLLNTEQTESKFDDLQSIWQDDPVPMQNTPPSVESFQNTPMCYELFPAETRAYEFRTPVKTLAPRTSVSPMTNASPNYNPSPVRMGFQLPTQFTRSPTLSTFSQGLNESATICTFCKKNGETPMVFTTHVVKEKVGNKHVVKCPILRSHVCSTCGATGDDAHTITYCPVLRSSNHGRPLASTTITLKNTRVKSNGRRRY